MRYETKIKQPQSVGGVTISPGGGELTDKQYSKVLEDKYGRSLIETGMLVVPAKGADFPNINDNKNGKKTGRK